MNLFFLSYNFIEKHKMKNFISRLVPALWLCWNRAVMRVLIRSEYCTSIWRPWKQRENWCFSCTESFVVNLYLSPIQGIYFSPITKISFNQFTRKCVYLIFKLVSSKCGMRTVQVPMTSEQIIPFSAVVNMK